MKFLAILLFPAMASANLNCTQVNQMTLCDNGVTAIQMGNITQVQTPQGNSTIYSIGNQRIVESPLPIPVIPPITPIAPSTGVLQPFK
jgi:hypothetical protein